MSTALLLCLFLSFPSTAFASKTEDLTVRIGATIFMVFLVAVLGLAWRAIRGISNKKKAGSIHVFSKGSQAKEASSAEPLDHGEEKGVETIKVLTMGACFMLLVAGLLGAYYIHSENNRFSIAVGDQGTAFKIDRETGQSWFIRADKEHPITLYTKDPPTPPAETAIQLTKASRAIDGLTPVDNFCRSDMESKKGYLKIHGWRAKRIDEGKYLVSYTFDQGSGERGYFFDVDVGSGIVRSAVGDPALEKIYSLGAPSEEVKPAGKKTLTAEDILKMGQEALGIQPQTDSKHEKDYDQIAFDALKKAVTAQKAYFAEHRRYSDTIGKLLSSSYGFSPTKGVELLVVTADAKGYVMTASHSHPLAEKTYMARGPEGKIEVLGNR